VYGFGFLRSFLSKEDENEEVDGLAMMSGCEVRSGDVISGMVRIVCFCDEVARSW
jgi:hypothetical protein